MAGRCGNRFWFTALGLLLLSMVVRAQEVQIRPLRLYGLNYNTRQGPDWSPTRCKSRRQVLEDLLVLSQITSRIRILSLIDCDQGNLVMSVIQNELAGQMQVWLGLWVGEDETVFTAELDVLKRFIDSGSLAGDRVLGITVGSEAVYRGEVSARQAVQYKYQAEELLAANGYDHLKVAICDVDDTYRAYRRLFVNTDIVFINSFPFWERWPIENAIDWFVSRKMPPVFNLAANAPNRDTGGVGKPVIIGETGWSSQGSNAAASDATGENQARYLRDLFCKVDRELAWQYFYFTGIDNSWRTAQDGIEDWVEGHFGIFRSDLTLKPHFAALQFSCPSDGDSIIYRFQVDNASVLQGLPTQSPTVPSKSACANNPGCAAVGLLAGDCCPAPNGLVLDCCGVDNNAVNAPPPTLVPTPLMTMADPTMSPPTTRPTPDPTATPPPPPTTYPTTKPTAAPVATPDPIAAPPPPTGPPTDRPTMAPALTTTTDPTATPPPPTDPPTDRPTMAPVLATTTDPTAAPPPPTDPPTDRPTIAPILTTTTDPTAAPRPPPTDPPTARPTAAPTDRPTETPTSTPPTRTPFPPPTPLSVPRDPTSSSSVTTSSAAGTRWSTKTTKNRSRLVISWLMLLTSSLLLGGAFVVG